MTAPFLPPASPDPKSPESLVFKPDSWFERLDLEKIFPSTQDRETAPIHVDLGAGDGGFIRTRAMNHPDWNFLAVERLLGRVRKICKGLLKDGTGNARVLRIEAAYAMEHLFPPASLSAITLLFPDPWPKRRHHPHRLVQKIFLERCALRLKPGGWMAIKTDDAPYFEHIVRTVQSQSALQVWKEATPENLLPEVTDFERAFQAEGRKFHFIALTGR